MSRFLAYTHIVLWAWHTPERLKPSQADILDSDAQVFASVATIWEIAIKCSLGKLTTVRDLERTLIATGLSILAVRPRHAEAVRDLPLHHRDPFDRMLVAQARSEDLTLVTADARMAAYDVRTL